MVPFGGIEAESEKSESEFHYSLGACGGGGYNRHGETEEREMG